eukprot:CAMPEP_0172517004 /NCGR_PEP_ID=MMETSP1066-20121228/281023_1 /TAXON_ID=671091 /ORGANISM="Coscinodiscus wailesii, Strain CCMP2513" /LENGTH=199 /DNA_ID=CAMNT_0013298749 /DNA_START=28 /DNA_END=624 /DNA_ORIENTATION=-
MTSKNDRDTAKALTNLFSNDSSFSSSEEEEDDDDKLPPTSMLDEQTVILPPPRHYTWNNKNNDENAAAAATANKKTIIPPITILQSENSCFDGYGRDNTGAVLWGAAIHLASWIRDELQSHNEKNSFVVVVVNDEYEYEHYENTARRRTGLGLGLPSLVAALSSSRVHAMATDGSPMSLALARETARRNGIDATRIRFV